MGTTDTAVQRHSAIPIASGSSKAPFAIAKCAPHLWKELTTACWLKEFELLMSGSILFLLKKWCRLYQHASMAKRCCQDTHALEIRGSLPLYTRNWRWKIPDGMQCALHSPQCNRDEIGSSITEQLRREGVSFHNRANKDFIGA